jgi:hypothetical protein
MNLGSGTPRAAARQPMASPALPRPLARFAPDAVRGSSRRRGARGRECRRDRRAASGRIRNPRGPEQQRAHEHRQRGLMVQTHACFAVSARLRRPHGGRRAQSSIRAVCSRVALAHTPSGSTSGAPLAPGTRLVRRGGAVVDLRAGPRCAVAWALALGITNPRARRVRAVAARSTPPPEPHVPLRQSGNDRRLVESERLQSLAHRQIDGMGKSSSKAIARLCRKTASRVVPAPRR